MNKNKSYRVDYFLFILDPEMSFWLSKMDFCTIFPFKFGICHNKKKVEIFIKKPIYIFDLKTRILFKKSYKFNGLITKKLWTHQNNSNHCMVKFDFHVFHIFFVFFFRNQKHSFSHTWWWSQKHIFVVKNWKQNFLWGNIFFSTKLSGLFSFFSIFRLKKVFKIEL